MIYFCIINLTYRRPFAEKGNKAALFIGLKFYKVISRRVIT